MKNKVSEIAKTIIEKTNNEEIEWKEEFNPHSDEFSANIGKMAVVIISHTDQEIGNHTFTLQILDEHRQIAGQLSCSNDDVDYYHLEILFEGAMATARNLSGVIDEMKKELESW